MRPRFHLSVLLIVLGLAAAPALAFDGLAVHLDPIQPLLGEDFVVVIEGHAETVPTAEQVVVGSQTLEIRLHRDACPSVCGSQSFRLEVPIDGSTSALAEGAHVLQLSGRVGPMPDWSPLFAAYFAVGEVYAHSMTPHLVLDPWLPTDNDRVRLLVPVRANGCGPFPPELERIERHGNTLSVFMRFEPFFGGELGDLPEDAPWKCSPPYPFLDVSRTELGVLAAGNYMIDLYFQSTSEPSLPLRVGRWEFPVADAPDRAALREDRFTVEVEWKDQAGNVGIGKPVPDPASDSTLFTFFGEDNWELLIKVLDGCNLNDRFWVFGSAATNVEYTITVTDTQTGAIWTYFNPLGRASKAINDTDAFATCSP